LAAFYPAYIPEATQAILICRESVTGTLPAPRTASWSATAAYRHVTSSACRHVAAVAGIYISVAVVDRTCALAVNKPAIRKHATQTTATASPERKIPDRTRKQYN
jgi:hypothetical protein